MAVCAVSQVHQVHHAREARSTMHDGGGIAVGVPACELLHWLQIDVYTKSMGLPNGFMSEVFC